MPGGAQGLQPTLSGPLEDLRTLRSTLRTPDARVAAPPSQTPPAPLDPAQPNTGYWSRLLEGEGIDLFNLADEEPAPPQAADAAAADPFRAEPISPEELLAVAREAQRLPISQAAAVCGFSDSLIYELLKIDGLTERGLRAAGDKADEINRLMRARNPGISSRRRLDIDGPRLLAIANLTRTMSLRAAGRAHGMGNIIFSYLTLQGLTSTGRNIAGPLADEIDSVMATRDPGVSLPQVVTPMTPEMLQSIVEAARNQPLNLAALSVGRTLQQIDGYVAPWGLTHAGRWVAGELADALDEALYQRYLDYGGAGAVLDGVQLPRIAPPAMRNRQLGVTGRSAAQYPRRTVTLEMLLAVTQAATSEGTIARACRACGANAATIGNYVGVRGLTIDGRTLAGNLAPRIEHHMRTFTKRHSRMPQLGPEPRADNRRAPQPRVPALGAQRPSAPAPAPAPAPQPLHHVGVEPSSTPPLAPARNVRAPLASGRLLPTQGNKRTSIDAIDLVAIARLSVTMSISDAAARVNISEAALHPFLSPFGLTPQGRALAGHYAEEIDRFTASRLEHLSALYSSLQAQGRSFTSLPDDPFVKELMQLVGDPSAARGDAQPTPGEPPMSTAPTETSTTREVGQPAQVDQPNQFNQPDQPDQPDQSDKPDEPGQPDQSEPPKQSKPRGKKRRLETRNVGGTARRQRPTAAGARSSSPTQEAAAALLDIAREERSPRINRSNTPQRETSIEHEAPDAPAVTNQPPGTTSANDTGHASHVRWLRNRTMSSVLLAVARSLLKKGSIVAAARANRVPSGSISKYLTLKGLTTVGAQYAGAHANKISALVKAAAKRRQGARNTSQTTRERSAASAAARTRSQVRSAASVDEQAPRRVKRSTLRTSIARAAGEPSTSQNAAASSLATDDRTVAGNDADEIGTLVLAGEGTQPNVTGKSMREAAKAARINRAKILRLRRLKGLIRTGKTQAGPLADEIDQLTREAAERRAALKSKVAVGPGDEPTASPEESAGSLSQESALESEDGFDDVIRLLNDDTADGAPLPDGADQIDGATAANDIDAMVAELTHDSPPQVASMGHTAPTAIDAAIDLADAEQWDSIDLSLLDSPQALNDIDLSILDSPLKEDTLEVPDEAVDELVMRLAEEVWGTSAGDAAITNEPIATSPSSALVNAIYEAPMPLAELDEFAESMLRFAGSPLSHSPFIPNEPLYLSDESLFVPEASPSATASNQVPQEDSISESEKNRTDD